MEVQTVERVNEELENKLDEVLRDQGIEAEDLMSDEEVDFILEQLHDNIVRCGSYTAPAC